MTELRTTHVLPKAPRLKTVLDLVAGHWIPMLLAETGQVERESLSNNVNHPSPRCLALNRT